MSTDTAHAALDAAHILGLALAAPAPLYIPEWGGQVWIKEMSGAERDAWELSCMEAGGGKVFSRDNFRARLAVFCVCNAEGVPLFRRDQVEQLGRASAAALNRIFEVAAPLNGITARDVEDLAGNSDAGPSAHSG